MLTEEMDFLDRYHIQQDPNARYQTAEAFANALSASAQKQELLSKAKSAFDPLTGEVRWG